VKRKKDKRQQLAQDILGDPRQEQKIQMVDSSNNKISQAIIDYAKPFLDECDVDEYEEFIGFAIVVWNICLMSGREREDSYNQLLDSLYQNDSEARAYWIELIKNLMDRKEKWFSGDQRFIMNYQIKIENGKINLTISAILNR
jgi:hypothetical protein